MSNYRKHPEKKKRVKTSGITLNNTMVFKENGFIIVQHFLTEIVKFNEKIVILKNDGYLTYTTKLRLNQTSSEFGLNFDIWQEKRKWYISTEQEKKRLFFDGIIIDRKTGKIINPDEKPESIPEIPKRSRNNPNFNLLFGKPVTVMHSELTSDCFLVQINGLFACNGNKLLGIPECEFKNTSECGGKAILEKIAKNQFPKNGLGKPVKD